MCFNQNSGSTTLLSHNSSATPNGSNKAATSLSLEPNPFEQSFATNDTIDTTNANVVHNHQQNGAAPQIHLPAGSPPILTPGGRRHILPPLSALSPNNINVAQQGNNINHHTSHNSTHSMPGTPGLMWSSLMNNTADGNIYQQTHQQSQLQTQQQQHQQQQQQQQQQIPNQNTNGIPLYSQRRTGLTPNESGLRTGLTPGGAGFLSGIQLPGLNTPSSLLHNSALTPGIGSLLDMSHLGQTNGSLSNAQAMAIQSHQQLLNNGSVQHHPQQDQLSLASLPGPQPTNDQLNGGSAKVKREAEKSSDLPPPKKQRGRKPKAKVDNRVESPEPESNDESSPSSNTKKNKKGSSTEEEKRKNFLERNRVAASKCRQRKKQLVNKMKEELNFYSSEHATLSNQVSTLREQVITLRTILFSHKECPALLEKVGGYDTLNTVLNATNYASQLPLQQTLEPTIVPHTTTIAPIEEQSKFQQELMANNNPSIATAAAVAVTTNNALNHLHQNHPQSARKI